MVETQNLSSRHITRLRKIEKCAECGCNFGSDWEYKDFSNKDCIVCPQCKTEYIQT